MAKGYREHGLRESEKVLRKENLGQITVRAMIPLHQPLNRKDPVRKEQGGLKSLGDKGGKDLNKSGRFVGRLGYQKNIGGSGLHQ